MQKQCHCNKH